MKDLILLMLFQNHGKGINLNSQSTIITMIGLICNILQPLLYIAPLKIFYNIYKHKKNNEASTIPYLYFVFNLFNSILWILLSVKKFDLAVLIANILSAFFFLVYLISYYITNSDSLEILMLKINTFTLFLFSITFLSWRFLNYETTGIIAVIIESISYLSTLQYMKEALIKKDSKYINIYISSSIAITSFFWIVYSIIDKNILVLIPNIIGEVVSISTFIIYYKFIKNNKSQGETIIKKF